MKIILCIAFLLFTGLAFGQTDSTQSNVKHPKRKGSFYFLWGYTRASFSKSTIHFSCNTNKFYPETGRYHDYDFTIYDAKAKDRPDFDNIKDVINVTIPQFVGRIGYYFNNKSDCGIEINFDHTKYVVTDYQRVRVKGTFNGGYVDKDTTLNPNNFLHYEHSDGANFLMINFVKRWKLYEPSKNFNIGLVAKPGAGVVIPRTDVTIYGTEVNNRWNLAGWIIGVEGGIRVEFLKHGVFEFVGKGSYADYRRGYILGAGQGRSHHHFFTAQLTGTIGLSF